MLASPFGLVDAQFLHHNASLTEERCSDTTKMLAVVGKLKVSQEKSVGQCHLMPTPTKWLGLSSLLDMNTSDIIQPGLRAIRS